MHQRDLLRRISLIRYVYKIGEQQAAGPAPYSAVAVLTFYDVIEWFLITGCEHFDVKVKKGSGIYDYFDGIERHREIFCKSLIDKVSSSRNEIKHRFTIPSAFSVKEAQFAAQNFLEENCSKLFSVHFVDASMSDLIANELVAASLREARSLMDNNDFQAAMAQISEAFHHLLQEFYSTSCQVGLWHAGLMNLACSISRGTLHKSTRRENSPLSPLIRPVDFATIFSWKQLSGWSKHSPVM